MHYIGVVVVKHRSSVFVSSKEFEHHMARLYQHNVVPLQPTTTPAPRLLAGRTPLDNAAQTHIMGPSRLINHASRRGGSVTPKLAQGNIKRTIILLGEARLANCGQAHLSGLTSSSAASPLYPLPLPKIGAPLVPY